ncbi:MAG: 1-(5-phosphoribosyl)-5-[(5-phosphoribosylamino)methylideneamino]imidazole-4-carboxamide isomerase [Candidatus Helarchaeales archaeon]
MIVIPAIDIKDQKCVRLFKGLEDHVTVYREDPLEAAFFFRDQGSSWLHVIDLNGAFGSGENLNIIKRIIDSVDLKIQVGGGIRSIERAELFYSWGVERIIVGTRAIKDPNFVSILADRIGKKHVCVAVDFRGEKVLVKGWTEESQWNVFDMAKLLEEKKAGWILFTHSESDGTLGGISSEQLEITKKMVQTTKIPIIAAGGIASEKDLEMLEGIGCAAAVTGKAIYENRFDLKRIFARFKK